MRAGSSGLPPCSTIPGAGGKRGRAIRGTGTAAPKSSYTEADDPKRLVALDREKNLITRDIVTIDLRLADRVTVRLSNAAAQARLEALKTKKKGGSA